MELYEEVQQNSLAHTSITEQNQSLLVSYGVVAS